MGRESRETWAKRVEQWKDSGLTAEEFALELGISAASLKWWKWRLGGTAAPRATEAAKKRGSAMTKASGAALSPLTFVEMAAPVVSEPPLEVVLPSSVRIRVRAGFDEVTLRRLLDVLERRR